jgi:hypothetical protein
MTATFAWIVLGIGYDGVSMAKLAQWGGRLIISFLALKEDQTTSKTLSLCTGKLIGKRATEPSANLNEAWEVV